MPDGLPILRNIFQVNNNDSRTLIKYILYGVHTFIWRTLLPVRHSSNNLTLIDPPCTLSCSTFCFPLNKGEHSESRSILDLIPISPSCVPCFLLKIALVRGTHLTPQTLSFRNLSFFVLEIASVVNLTTLKIATAFPGICQFSTLSPSCYDLF